MFDLTFYERRKSVLIRKDGKKFVQFYNLSDSQMELIGMLTDKASENNWFTADLISMVSNTYKTNA